MDFVPKKGSKVVSGKLVNKFQRHQMQERRIQRHLLNVGDSIDELYYKSLQEIADQKGLQTKTQRWYRNHAKNLLEKGEELAQERKKKYESRAQDFAANVGNEMPPAKRTQGQAGPFEPDMIAERMHIRFDE